MSDELADLDPQESAPEGAEQDGDYTPPAPLPEDDIDDERLEPVEAPLAENPKEEED